MLYHDRKDNNFVDKLQAIFRYIFLASNKKLYLFVSEMDYVYETLHQKLSSLKIH